jgi:hypothetical protein
VPIVIDALDKRDEILDAGREMLHALTKLVEERCDMPVRAQGVVDGQVDLRLVFEHFCLRAGHGSNRVPSDGGLDARSPCSDDAGVELHFGHKAQCILQRSEKADTINDIANPMVRVRRDGRAVEVRIGITKAGQNALGIGEARRRGKRALPLDQPQHRPCVGVARLIRLVQR